MLIKKFSVNPGANSSWIEVCVMSNRVFCLQNSQTKSVVHSTTIPLQGARLNSIESWMTWETDNELKKLLNMILSHAYEMKTSLLTTFQLTQFISLWWPMTHSYNWKMPSPAKSLSTPHRGWNMPWELNRLVQLSNKLCWS